MVTDHPKIVALRINFGITFAMIATAGEFFPPAFAIYINRCPYCYQLKGTFNTYVYRYI
jgi:hypothetical protein